jgi:hypothetical protein
MKRPITGKQRPTPEVQQSDAQAIDTKYGLEPVIDLSVFADDAGAAGGMQFHVVDCPYCGESFETPIDTSAGSARYVEDCQVCCQPIEFSVEVDHAGVLKSLATLRGD